MSSLPGQIREAVSQSVSQSREQYVLFNQPTSIVNCPGKHKGRAHRVPSHRSHSAVTYLQCGPRAQTIIVLRPFRPVVGFCLRSLCPSVCLFISLWACSVRPFSRRSRTFAVFNQNATKSHALPPRPEFVCYHAHMVHSGNSDVN